MKLLVVDDHPLVRAGVASAMRSVAADTQVLEASDGVEALACLSAHLDVSAVVLDLRMAGMAGMPQRRFQLVNFASGIVWVAAFVGPGYAGARGMALLSHLSWQALALSTAAFLLATTAAFNRRRIVGAVRLGLPNIRASAAILGGAPQLAAR